MTTHSSSQSPWFVLSVALMGIIGGYGLATVHMNYVMGPALLGQAANPGAPVPQQPQEPPRVYDPPSTDDDEILGSEDAAVTLIEFTDYQCPFCGRHYNQTFGEIKKKFVDTGKVKHVVRDFPLSFHQHAQKAAEATECAAEAGKFWEMHDMLFTKQQEWSGASNAQELFKQYATGLGIPGGAFSTCLDEGKQAEEVKKDFADGTKAGISGTPGFWVIGPDGKGQMITGAVPFSNFEAVIEPLLRGA